MASLVPVPSDCVYIAVTKFMLTSCKARSDHISTALSLQILTFLGDNIDDLKGRSFHSLADFSEEFSKFVPDSRIIQLIVEDLVTVKSSIDHLMNYINSALTLFAVDSSTSPNEVPGPTSMCADSFLGSFVRTILAKWECLQFDGICSLYESVCEFFDAPKAIDNGNFWGTFGNVKIKSKVLPLLVGHSDEIVDNHIPDEQAIDVNLQYLLNSQKSMLNEDIASTEEFLHKFFDSNGNDPLNDLPHNTANELAKGKALLALMRNNTIQPNRTLHQDAMINLAMMWTLAGNSSMALSAVEEAMKTAHQRGDHRSVAKALLLMFRIFQGSQRMDLLASAEDILVRCIERCASLKLNVQLCDASILLVGLRAKGPLRYNPRFQGEDEEEEGGDQKQSLAQHGLGHSHARWSASQLWLQLSATLVGDVTVITQVLQPGSSAESVSSSGANQLNQPPHMQQHPQDKKNAPNDSPTPLCPALVEFTLKAVSVSADLWMRLGQPHMTEFVCRKAIIEFIHHGTSRELVEVFAKLLRVKTDIIANIAEMDRWCFHPQHRNTTSNSNSNSNSKPNSTAGVPTPEVPTGTTSKATTRRAFHKVLHLYTAMHAVFPATYPTSISKTLEAAFIYILVHEAISAEQWDKAERLATRLTDIESTPDASYVEGGLGLGLGLGEESQITVTEGYCRARILLAKVIFRSDFTQSQDILNDVALKCGNAGFVQTQYEAVAYRAIGLWYSVPSASPDSLDSIDAMTTIHEVINFSRENGFNSVENIVAKCWDGF